VLLRLLRCILRYEESPSAIAFPNHIAHLAVTESPTSQRRPLRVLTIDGGGVRGIVPLTILNQLAKHMKEAGAAGSKPSDWFDLIVGTSTGGILTVLLGALLLSIKECIEIYRELSTVAFPPVSRCAKCCRGLCRGAMYNVDQFEEMLKVKIKEILNQKAELLGLASDINLDEIKLSGLPSRSGDNPRPRIAVVGKRGNFNCAFCFTNFPCDTSRHHKQDELLWKVLRATSAASFFFDPIAIGKVSVLSSCVVHQRTLFVCYLYILPLILTSFGCFCTCYRRRRGYIVVS
jgi:Patatin-like phospholipase